MALKYLEAAATENDTHLFEWMGLWARLQERKLKAGCDPGSLEHYDVMYDYFMFKRDMRRGEGVEAWPYENDEPYDDKDWKVFLRHHEKLKSDRLYEAPWPPNYPSDDPAKE